MFVGVAYITLDTKDCMSLKENRNVTRSLIARSKRKFPNFSISQIGNANNFKEASIGISFVASNKEIVSKSLLKCMDFIEEYSFRTILESNNEVLSF